MEEYPEELRTPPVPLACLVGCPEVHNLLTTHLLSLQPPMNTIALPDFSKISVIPSKKPPRENYEAVRGILKRDWLSKHRTRIPSVVAALFSSRDIFGDPSQWLQVCTDLENLKATIRGRNIKLILVNVDTLAHKDETIEDRVTALRKRAEVDSKNLITFVLDNELELQQSLNRHEILLTASLADLSNLYYKDEGRRIKARLERKSFSSMELHVRYGFKGAVYAEFRRDWLEALKLYEDAYHTLQEMIGKSSGRPPIQYLLEIKTIAEYLHFKMSTLLQHGGKYVDASSLFRKHTTDYRIHVGAPEVVFLHWEWLSRQYLAFAQLLESSTAVSSHVPNALPVPTEKPNDWELYPAHYYQLAAFYLKEKNKCLEFAVSMSEDSDTTEIESVVGSSYLGQFSRLIELENSEMLQSLTDEEFVRYSIVEGKRFQDSYEIIALLKRSFDAYSGIKAKRTASHCAFLLAREYFSVGEMNDAKQLFDNVAAVYRLEGWLLLLWNALGYLRECSRETNSVKDFVEYSLEMAALPVTGNVFDVLSQDCGPAGPATLSQREKIHNEAFEVALKVDSEYPLYLEIDAVSPLRTVLISSVAFHQPVVKPGQPSLVTISLRSQLPVEVEIDQLEVQFNQSECSFMVGNGRKPPVLSSVKPCRRIEIAPSLVLSTNKWLRLTYEIKSDQSGKLECIYVIARIGPHVTVCSRAESPASIDELPLWKYENLLQTIPTKDPCLALSGQKAVQVEEADPQVDLILGSAGPALVGEGFILPVTVSSKGHSVISGELKINLVDTKGGGLLSPREEESISADNLHVELVDVAHSLQEKQFEEPPDRIRKIQPSFGLISVPPLAVGDVWSCRLEIRWNRPKPIMVFVSLGYCPEAGHQKVHVHKSLQVEGRTAVALSHRFMLPFRQDPLVLSKIKSVAEPGQIPSLASDEPTVVVVSVRNCSDVPLRLLSMSVDSEEEGNHHPPGCEFRPRNVDFRLPEAVHKPGEVFKQVFGIVPRVTSIDKVRTGVVSLRWERADGSGSSSSSSSSQVVKYRIPDVNVELPPLVVSLDCPPDAVIGKSFVFSVRIRNRTELIQEIKFSVADSASFVSSGPHGDTIFVLPGSEYLLSYVVVPLGLGYSQLPRVTLSSIRYSAGLQPSSHAVFVYP
ncbi:hypothetical protein M569_01938, partial [Genlisea aurea]